MTIYQYSETLSNYEFIALSRHVPDTYNYFTMENDIYQKTIDY